MVVQLLDPSFWDQPHQETNKTLCSASRLHSRPAMASSTNTKEEIEGKAGPTGGSPVVTGSLRTPWLQPCLGQLWRGQLRTLQWAHRRQQ